MVQVLGHHSDLGKQTCPGPGDDRRNTGATVGCFLVPSHKASLMGCLVYTYFLSWSFSHDSRSANYFKDYFYFILIQASFIILRSYYRSSENIFKV